MVAWLPQVVQGLLRASSVERTFTASAGRWARQVSTYRTALQSLAWWGALYPQQVVGMHEVNHTHHRSV